MNALDLEQILNNFIKICLFEEIVLCFMTRVFSFQRQTCTYNYRLIKHSVYLPYENIQGVKCDWKVNCSFVENSVLRFSVDINGVNINLMILGMLLTKISFMSLFIKPKTPSPI